MGNIRPFFYDFQAKYINSHRKYHGIKKDSPILKKSNDKKCIQNKNKTSLNKKSDQKSFGPV